MSPPQPCLRTQTPCPDSRPGCPANDEIREIEAATQCKRSVQKRTVRSVKSEKDRQEAAASTVVTEDSAVDTADTTERATMEDAAMVAVAKTATEVAEAAMETMSEKRDALGGYGQQKGNRNM